MHSIDNPSGMKLSKKLLIFGVFVLVVGIILVVVGISTLVKNFNNKNSPAMEQYNRDYAIYQQECLEYDLEYLQWQEDFMDGNATISDQPQRPTPPTKPSNNRFSFPTLLFIGAPVTFIGLALVLTGARPYLFKSNAKLLSETLDYVGDDITQLGMSAVDITTPVMKKASEATTPIIKDVSKSIASGVKEGLKDDNNTTSMNGRYCSYCGTKTDRRHKYCPNCGKRIDQ